MKDASPSKIRALIWSIPYVYNGIDIPDLVGVKQ